MKCTMRGIIVTRMYPGDILIIVQRVVSVPLVAAFLAEMHLLMGPIYTSAYSGISNSTFSSR